MAGITAAIFLLLCVRPQAFSAGRRFVESSSTMVAIADLASAAVLKDGGGAAAAIACFLLRRVARFWRGGKHGQLEFEVQGERLVVQNTRP